MIPQREARTTHVLDHMRLPSGAQGSPLDWPSGADSRAEAGPTRERRRKGSLGTTGWQAFGYGGLARHLWAALRVG